MKRAREPESVEHTGTAASSGEKSPLASIKAVLGIGRAQVCCQGSLQLASLPTIAGRDADGNASAVSLSLKGDSGNRAGAAAVVMLIVLLWRRRRADATSRSHKFWLKQPEVGLAKLVRLLSWDRGDQPFTAMQLFCVRVGLHIVAASRCRG